MSTTCCICNGGICCHTGPCSFCEEHKHHDLWAKPQQVGWKCPVCGSGVAPGVVVCPNCSMRPSEESSTRDSSSWPNIGTTSSGKYAGPEITGVCYDLF